MEKQLYPLIFEPVLGQVETSREGGDPWFSDCLESYDIATPANSAVEQWWLLADTDDVQSTVANGAMAGLELRQLTESRPRELLGRNYRGATRFPLVVRIFATDEDQPIMVHADNLAPAATREQHANMKLWYSLLVQPGACAYIGIDPRVSAQQLLGQLDSVDAQRFLQQFKIKPGDSCLIPPGIVHSLSAGHLILEFGASSAHPLRLGTWQEGKEIPEAERRNARRFVKPESRQSLRAARVRGPLTHTRKIPLTRHWPYFMVEEIRIADHIFLETGGTSCHLLFLLAGRLLLQFGEDREITLPAGRICCIPASLGHYKLTALEPSELLRAVP